MCVCVWCVHVCVCVNVCVNAAERDYGSSRGHRCQGGGARLVPFNAHPSYGSAAALQQGHLFSPKEAVRVDLVDKACKGERL